MGNGASWTIFRWCLDYLSILIFKIVTFHSYVSLPEGNLQHIASSQRKPQFDTWKPMELSQFRGVPWFPGFFPIWIWIDRYPEGSICKDLQRQNGPLMDLSALLSTLSELPRRTSTAFGVPKDPMKGCLYPIHVFSTQPSDGYQNIAITSHPPFIWVTPPFYGPVWV